MLVLSRHHNQSIIIRVPGGPEIKMQVVDIRGDKVRIGITAPGEVTVHREEVQRAINGGAGR